jgi:hypothetical protein
MSDVTFEVPEEPEKPRRGRKSRDRENSREIAELDQFHLDMVEADHLYGDGMPYEKDRIENEIRFYLSQTAQSLFESGKRFMLLKRHEGHGGFMEALERIGVPSSTAHYAMAVVLKFGPNFPPVGNLGVAKLKMLTVFDDDDIKTYVDGGPLGNIPHDDVEQMSKRELQAAVREERKRRKEERKAQEDAIAKKETKINELEQQIRYQQPPTKEQLARIAVQEYRDPIIDNILEASERMRRAIAAIDEAQKVPGVPYEALEELLEPYKENFNAFCDVSQDLIDAFNNIHVDKGRG